MFLSELWRLTFISHVNLFVFYRLPETAELQRQKRCIQHIWNRTRKHLVRTSLTSLNTLCYSDQSMTFTQNWVEESGILIRNKHKNLHCWFLVLILVFLLTFSIIMEKLTHKKVTVCCIAFFLMIASVLLIKCDTSLFFVRLTAFVLRSFSKAKSFVYIDPEKLEQSKVWLEQNQNYSGCFQQSGSLFNNRMKV